MNVHRQAVAQPARPQGRRPKPRPIGSRRLEHQIERLTVTVDAGNARQRQLADMMSGLLDTVLDERPAAVPSRRSRV